jgi:2-pyrone-4,6-dicarboxylate lactonase
VVSVDGGVTDAELRAMHDQGARGICVNLADKGGNPFARFSELITLSERLRPMGWHIEFLIHVHQMDEHIADINKLRVETSIGHFGYMPAALGVSHPKFQTFLERVSDGRFWVKLSGSYRITSMKRPPYTDVTPFAHALVSRRHDRILWGSDWPHPICPVPMPNDGDLLDQLAVWVPDAGLRKQILADNPATLYGF